MRVVVEAAGSVAGVTSDVVRLRSAVEEVVGDVLHDADRLFSEIHQCLRLTFGNAAAVPDQLPPPLQQFMLSRMDLADEQQLTLLLETTLETVSAILNQYLANDQPISA